MIVGAIRIASTATPRTPASPGCAPAFRLLRRQALDGAARRPTRSDLLLLPTFIAYIALTVILPKAAARLYASREEEVFWRGVSAGA